MRPEFKKITDYIWEIDPSFKAQMQVPARVIASKKLLDSMEDIVFDQLTNVASLPGIVNYALAMPDAHVGYGACIGSVAAFDLEKGVIVPGIVGFDINCGMRLATTSLTTKEVTPKIEQLINSLFREVPAGVGAKGFIKLGRSDFEKVIVAGAGWAVENGMGKRGDLEHTEEFGAIVGADPAKISDKAFERGINQLGTLGSGNHYLEVQKVAEIFDRNTAAKFGINSVDQVVVMLHCGSRGFGHQVATDYLRVFEKAMEKYQIRVTDRQLAAAPAKSSEGQDYYTAAAAAANLAFCNRQVILHRVREVFGKIFGQAAADLNLVYDVAHNIAKIEEHAIDSQIKKLLVLRKGATRAFGKGNEQLPSTYRDLGQPVIIGGSMETSSYLLIGLAESDKISFSSTAHGAGRRMSRTAAAKQIQGRQLAADMRKRGIYVQSVSARGLAEEAGIAYKDISAVVEVTEAAGISAKVARFAPIGSIKG